MAGTAPEARWLALQPTPRLTRPSPPERHALPLSLSVIIVNYCQWRNTAMLTRQLSGGFPLREGSAEVVIIDNSSPTHPLMERLRRAPKVSLRRFARNRGFAYAVNEGCRLGQGEWLLILNPDISVPANFLEQVSDLIGRVHDDIARVGVIGFGLRHSDGSPQPSSGPFPTLFNTLRGLLMPRRARRCRAVPGHERVQVPWVTGCCLLVRRDCLREVGGFDENFFLYYEDVDLCHRAVTRGWSVWYEPNIQVVHHSPLHTRRVPAPLRLITRHALMHYGTKHWPGWQQALLHAIIWVEALCRQRYVRWRGDARADRIYGELRGLIGDWIHDRGLGVRKRLRRAAKQLEVIAEQLDGQGC